MTREQFLKAIENNSITKQLKRVAEKYGYKASESPYITEYGHINCAIYPEDRRPRSFYPEFYLNVSLTKTNEEDFYKYKRQMGTTAYGGLEWEELDKYVKWITNAKKLYDELVKIDLYKLAQRPAEFDD